MGSFGAGGWKNASTLIVAARNRLADRSDHRFSFGRFTFDYSVMMLKRSARSSFFAKAYVFPGGAVEAADFDGTWLLLLAQHGLSRQRLMSQFMRANRPRPPIYSTVCGTEPEAEIGFRIAAIRETFEETGVLFCRGQATEEPAWSGDDDIRHWQERIHDDPRQFQELCRQKNVYPDVSSLYEWSNWLTPTGMGGKRYDTIFYIRVLDTVPDTRIDCGEITDLMWSDPVKSIWQHVQSQIYLAPPQIYELSRLAHFGEGYQLENFARRRQELGTERWLPVRVPTDSTGWTTVLPGDSLYPQEPGNSLLSTGDRFNRMIFTSPSLCQMSCNVTDPFGHKPPLNLLASMNEELEIASKL